MKGLGYIIFICAIILGSCNNNSADSTEKSQVRSIDSLEMNLSAFGVESDRFPSIKAHVDLVAKKGTCRKFYYNPRYLDTIYFLGLKDITEIIRVLGIADTKILKQEYSVTLSDQPTSEITFFQQGQKWVIRDYGLKGEFPLQDLYRIVYKL